MRPLQPLSQSEREFQIGISENWEPYLRAVGCDTSGWDPFEIYTLAAIVWRDREVDASKRTKHLAWQITQPKPEPGLITWEQIQSWAHPKDFLLEAIQELLPAKKQELKAKVLAARGKK